MSNEFVPDQTGILEYLTQPVLTVREERIVYRNQAAARLLLAGESRLDELLGEAELELYRAFDGRGLLELALRLGGRDYGATVHRRGEGDVFVARELPAAGELSLDTLLVISRGVRDALAEMADARTTVAGQLAAMDNPRLRLQLARIERCHSRLLRLAGNLSTLNRLLSGRCTPRLEDTELRAYFEELCGRAAPLCGEASVELRFSCGAASLFAAIDRGLMERAFLNLLDNALRYTAAGGRISVRLEQLDSSAYLTVSDDGEGIEPGQMPTIFDRYRRQEHINDARWGLGLGLSLARHVAALHGGTLVLQSEPGAGTGVTLSFSRWLEDERPESFHAPRRSPDETGGADNVLLELSSSLPAELYDPLELF